MRKLQKQLFLSLIIFDGEGSDGADGTDGAQSTDAEVTSGDIGLERAGNGSATADTQESEADVFDKFIKEHKSEYEKRIKCVVNERLKGTNKMRADYEASKPVLDRIMSRYGAKDINELSSKLDNDNEYYRTKAAEMGMSEESFREYESMKLRLAQQEQSERQREKDEFMQNLFRQEAEVKEIYPDFNLEAEMENPEFLSLIKHGTPALHAYRMLNYDALMSRALTEARQTASMQTAEAIRSGKERANEIGTGRGTPGRTSGVDISKLTKEQCDEFERQALRGKRITFG